MPHQCVRCNTFYDDGSSELLKGCSCGAKLFFFIKKERLAAAQKTPLPELSLQQKEQIELDVREIVGDASNDTPVVLDFESVRISRPGTYELDVVKLFSSDTPIVFKLDEGKYVIDIAESFDRLRKRK